MTEEATPTARVFPYLSYRDADKAIEFLVHALGFEEESRFTMEDGRIAHASLSLEGGQTVLLATAYDEMNQKTANEVDGWYSQVMCFVADVDAHCARAKTAGAEITQDVQDEPWGGRMYRCEDPEGHRWMFATQVVEMDEAEIEKALKEQ